MIQFNLLPDVKLQYIKAKRMKRLTMSISILVAGASLLIAVFTFIGVNVIQKSHMNSLGREVLATAHKIQNTKDIDKIITVQNQLNSLTDLHNNKPATSRLFDYLTQVTPSNVTISNIVTDNVLHSFSISGGAKDLLGVNTFIDTLKFTSYQSDADATKTLPAFSQVILSGFSASEKSATYQVTLTFDPAIFDNQHKIQLIVPQGKITTRSQVSQPTALFQNTTPKAGGQ